MTASASPRFSFRGWSFQAWAVKNAGYVKGCLKGALLASAGAPVLDVATLKVVGAAWGIALAGIAIGAAVDAVHYFLAEDPE